MLAQTSGVVGTPKARLSGVAEGRLCCICTIATESGNNEGRHFRAENGSDWLISPLARKTARFAQPSQNQSQAVVVPIMLEMQGCQGCIPALMCRSSPAYVCSPPHLVPRSHLSCPSFFCCGASSSLFKNATRLSKHASSALTISAVSL